MVILADSTLDHAEPDHRHGTKRGGKEKPTGQYTVANQVRLMPAKFLLHRGGFIQIKTPIRDVSREKLENDLKSLHNAVDTHLRQPHPPRTALEIIDQQGREEFWERILAYFINPSEPHGFGTDVLQAFLKALAETPNTTVPRMRTRLEHISLETQITADDGNPDILLWKDDKWFIIIEMKVRSSESQDQTERYGRSKQFGPIRVKDYTKNDRHYVYLNEPGGRPPKDTETFDQVTWKEILDYLETVVENDRGRYPTKSRAQFVDFLDTIKTEFDMTEYNANLRERAVLQMEFQDAIEAVDGRLEQFAQEQRVEWPQEFRLALDKSQVEGDWRPHQRSESYNYGHLYRQGWLLGPETLSVGDENGEIAAAYVTEMSADELAGRTLQMQFKPVKKWLDNSLIDKIRDYFNNHRERLEPFIQSDDQLRFHDRSNAAVFSCVVTYDIADGDSVGEQLAQAVMDTNPEFHNEVSRVFCDAVASIDQANLN